MTDDDNKNNNNNNNVVELVSRGVPSRIAGTGDYSK